MTLNIQLSTDFNPSTVNFSKLRKNKNGGKTVYLNNSNGGSILLQLPYMRAPFGLSTFTDESSKKTSYSLDLSFDNEPEISEFQDKILALDEIILDLVEKNATDWLGKKFNKVVLKEALHKPLVKRSKGDYAPTLKLKIMTDMKSGDFIPEVYNSRRERVDPDTIERGQRVMAIIDLASIWFIDNKFGVSARLKQCLLAPSKKLPAFAFQGVPPPEEVLEEEEEEEGEIDM